MSASRLWLSPGTAFTWLCRSGHINPRTTTACAQCPKSSR